MNKLVSMAAVALATSSLAACTAAPAEESGSTESKIIGGGDDATHTSVAFLRSVRQVGLNGAPVAVGGCTATLIAPRVMITAAHCTAEPGMWNDVSFDQAPDMFAPHGAAGWISAALVTSPLYDGDTSHGHDVGLVLLGELPQRATVGLGAPPPVASTVTAVGYGMNTFGSDGAGSGRRRVAAFPLLGIGEHVLAAGVDGLGTCHGDSGGPLLVDGVIVGITSYGDTVDCHNTDYFTRVDDNVAFLRTFVPSL
jgi:secreted trypsin-like serine protease